jgi:hypothetical protein
VAGEPFGELLLGRRQVTPEERVVLGEAGERGDGILPHRRREPFGKCHRVVEGPRPVHACPGHHYRVLRLAQDGREPFERLRVGRGPVDDVVVVYRLGSASQSSIGIETKTGPRGCCMAVW